MMSCNDLEVFYPYDNGCCSYMDELNDISKEELYEGLLSFGLFSDKLPKALSSCAFYKYCCEVKYPFKSRSNCFICFDSMRNINTFRTLGIPDPFSYQVLCHHLMNNWENLKKYFSCKTDKSDLNDGDISQDPEIESDLFSSTQSELSIFIKTYQVSRIHIRKIKNSKAIFTMNYPDWGIDGDPNADLQMFSKYQVRADISTCFPSMYTHALAWALLGKKEAKKNRSSDHWANKLDRYTRDCQNGETHGIITGPHASNILSEIILVAVDSQLHNWKYVRYIDDYVCYVDSYSEAKRFLFKLKEALREYGLVLNDKKTKIVELPLPSVEPWVVQMHFLLKLQGDSFMNFTQVKLFFDKVIELFHCNDNNASILKYAIKVLSNKKMSKNAQTYYIKTVFSLCLLYPYLVHLLEDCVFELFNISKSLTKLFCQKLFSTGYRSGNYESVYFSLYFAIKYEIDLGKFESTIVIDSNSCLFKLFATLYFKKTNNKENLSMLVKHAKELASDNYVFGKNWLFIYETLSLYDLKVLNKNKDSKNKNFFDNWINLKKKQVSFISFDKGTFKN